MLHATATFTQINNIYLHSNYVYPAIYLTYCITILFLKHKAFVGYNTFTNLKFKDHVHVLKKSHEHFMHSESI